MMTQSRSILILVMGILGILMLSLVFYKHFRKKTIRFKVEKLKPKLSVVLVVQNNQMLLRHTIGKLLEIKKVDEILVLDLGSVDKTQETSKELLGKHNNCQVLYVNQTKMIENLFSIIKAHTKGDIVYILDLYKINETNPNIYVPHLLQPLKKILENEILSEDPRIDGKKLLYFDELEREKNEYILKEYILEALSNIHMRMEICSQEVINNTQLLGEESKKILVYLEQTIRKLTLLSNLIGTVKTTHQTLHDNITQIFSDYSRNHRVSIDWKVIGTEKKLDESVNRLILRILQDLLYMIIQYNLSSQIDIQMRYRKKQLQLFLKYDGLVKGRELLDEKNGLSYYVLQSIQNRLNIVGGKIHLKERSTGNMCFLMKLPINDITCEHQVGMKDEK